MLPSFIFIDFHIATDLRIVGLVAGKKEEIDPPGCINPFQGVIFTGVLSGMDGPLYRFGLPGFFNSPYLSSKSTFLPMNTCVAAGLKDHFPIVLRWRRREREGCFHR